MQQPSALIVTDAAKPAVEVILTAFRSIPCGFARALLPKTAINPTPASQPTHWLCFDQSLDEEEVAIIEGFPQGHLPPLTDPEAAWGQHGLMSEADAKAALSAENLQIHRMSGNVEPIAFCTSLLNELGLMFVPEPVI